jgi:hypothetical protein
VSHWQKGTDDEGVEAGLRGERRHDTHEGVRHTDNLVTHLPRGGWTPDCDNGHAPARNARRRQYGRYPAGAGTERTTGGGRGGYGTSVAGTSS